MIKRDSSLIADTAVSGTSYSFDMLFSYSVPENMADTVQAGCRILVPFGRGNKTRTAVVMNLRNGDTNCLKPITIQVDSEPVIPEELVKLAYYLHDNTFCSYYDAIKAMLPPGYNLVLSDNEIPKNAIGDLTVKMVRLSDEYIKNPQNFKLTPKQKIVANTLSEYLSASEKEIAYICGVTSSVVKRLVANGVAVAFENETFRKTVNVSKKRDINDTVLSAEQQRAFDVICSNIKSRTASCFLLHGVTGSGKTAVFEKLIYDTVSMGRTALLLIPEIALTPQILNRFGSLFGERVAVLHSGLSMGQRYDEYKRIKQGMADIVIGTRSAIFAPLENIGLIVMDEEGERSYKSDSTPRYNTSDVARQRCRYHNAVLLLASATPSIESYYKAERNIYNLVELKERYNSAQLPDVQIVDMNLERKAGNRTELSRVLADEIRKNIDNHEQTILLLNRRGYHTIISCVQCCQPVYCPNCTVPMTYHKANGKMMCHYCGNVSEMPVICDKCGSEKFKMTGFGTQRIEEELEMFFPDARILRMDADTTFSRYSYEKNFSDFADGKYDIMLGTQMIGKGLDFPDVTLVGVLSVDNSLYNGDFRSYERTFSLITQVVGRGGRDGKKARAYLQTFMPDHYVINLASQQDYTKFYKEEIMMRRSMLYPPVCDLCIIGLSGADENQVSEADSRVMQIISEMIEKSTLKTPLRVIGPVKCSHLRINGKFRHRIIMKCKNTEEIRCLISNVIKEASKCRELSKVSIYADMNGDIGI